MATATEANALGYNLDVDYVVRYSFGDVGELIPGVCRPIGAKWPCRSITSDPRAGEVASDAHERWAADRGATGR